MAVKKIRYKRVETYLAFVNVPDDIDEAELQEMATLSTGDMFWGETVEPQGDSDIEVDSIEDTPHEHTEVWLDTSGGFCYFDPYDMVEL